MGKVSKMARFRYVVQQVVIPVVLLGGIVTSSVYITKHHGLARADDVRDVLATVYMTDVRAHTDADMYVMDEVDVMLVSTYGALLKPYDDLHLQFESLDADVYMVYAWTDEMKVTYVVSADAGILYANGFVHGDAVSYVAEGASDAYVQPYGQFMHDHLVHTVEK